jgi:kynurenine formamidase
MNKSALLLSLSLAIWTIGCGQQPASEDGASSGLVLIAEAAGPDLSALAGKTKVVDLTVLMSETLPAHWAGMPPLQRWANNWFVEKKNEYGTVSAPSAGPYYSQRYVIDEHTGTQSDFPAHFVPPPDSGLEFAGPMGNVTGDKYPLSRMMGPAAVIDVTAIRDQAEPGMSPRITLDRVKAFESEHGEIQAGDVVLFHSGYTDAYYKPLPEGLRLVEEPVARKSTPGWPAPEPEVMDYLHQKGVWHLGTDGPSMGYSEGGQPTHIAGLKHGMSWEEMLINLGELPARGAYYLALPIKVVDQSGSPTRAIAFVPNE